MTRLDEIKARLEKATPGPWAVAGRNGYLNQVEIAPAIATAYGAGEEVQANAALIAHAPADIAYLLGEVERLREVLTEIVESVDDDKHPMNSYAAGYAGGLRENVERAQKALKGGE